MKTIDDLVNCNEFLESEISRVPSKQRSTLMALTNIYVSVLLENKEKLIEKQKGTLEKYMIGLSKEYDIKIGYFKQMMNLVESYYCSKDVKNNYAAYGK